MSEENKKQEVNEAFAEAIERLNNMRGGVEAFMILAITDKPAKDGEKDAVDGINAASGRMKDLITLYENVDNSIKAAAAAEGIMGIMSKLANYKKENKNDE